MICIKFCFRKFGDDVATGGIGFDWVDEEIALEWEQDDENKVFIFVENLRKYMTIGKKK